MSCTVFRTCLLKWLLPLCLPCPACSSHFISSLRWLIAIPFKTFYISHFSLRRIFYPSSPIVKYVHLKIMTNASDEVFVSWLSLLCRHLINAVYLLSLTPRSLLLINKIDWHWFFEKVYLWATYWVISFSLH